MKKTVFTCILLLAAATASAGTKIATVDLMKLARNHPDYERNREFLTAKDKDLKTKLDSIKKEGETLQAEGRKMAEQFRNPMLSDKMKADLEKKLMDVQQKLISIEQRYRSESVRARQDLQEDESRMLKSSMDDLRKRLASFAQENGYDLILDRAAVPFSKDSFDVTDAVLEKMGVDPKKARSDDAGK